MLRAFGMSIDKKFILQGLKYCVVGVINTAVDNGTAFLFLNYIIVKNEYAALTAGIIAGTVNSYFMNKYWTFDKAKGGRDKFIKFLIVAVCAYLSSLLMMRCLQGIDYGSMNLNFLIKKLIVSVVYTLISFFGSKYFVFTEKSESAVDQHDRNKTY